MLDLESIEPALRALGIWAPIGFIVIYASARCCSSPARCLASPAAPCLARSGARVWNLAGATLGATAAFLLARTVAGEWVARRVGGRLRRLVDGVTAEGWRFVALMRLVPLVPFNLLNYALGLTGISLAGLCSDLGRLHAAGRRRLYLARLCGPLGRGRRHRGPALWTARPWSACHDRIPAPVVSPISRATEPVWIESDELQRRLAAGDQVCCLDVRQPDEFTSPPGHLPGAINVPLADLADRTSDLARRKQPIVVVCKTDRRSARAAAELLAAGLKDVAVLRGGTDGWHQRGLALE